MTTKQPAQIILGEDLGMGANKIFGMSGGVEVPSQVSINGAQQVTKMLGLRSKKPPLHVENEQGSFYIGGSAHDWGHPIENLDYDRLIGAPEMRALFYGSLTHYMKSYGSLDGDITVTVGMPLEPLTGEDAQQNVYAVRRWMKGSHCWKADGQQYEIYIQDVKITSQPVGALFDYLLDEQGVFIPERKAVFGKEVGIISVGFNTVELLVVRNKQTVQRFTVGTTAGVRRLLEITNPRGMYSMGELDTLLRSQQLDIRDALVIWEREVTGVIESTWGQSWKRFAAILMVGGGTILLANSLSYHFRGKVYIPENPVLSIARGLYKLGLFQERRKRR
ncbi:MAG: ParM/StbA family protein [Anaerolineae bacterium]|nr:ParM/StbA family protein [Anaerolineae bacterium]MBT7989998.1 ParM/StbA family protein [Anaerolineae bacterium]